MIRIMDTLPTGHFAYWTVRLLFGHFAYWTVDSSPIGQFGYRTFRLLLGQFAYRLIFILPTRLPE